MPNASKMMMIDVGLPTDNPWTIYNTEAAPNVASCEADSTQLNANSGTQPNHDNVKVETKDGENVSCTFQNIYFWAVGGSNLGTVNGIRD